MHIVKHCMPLCQSDDVMRDFWHVWSRQAWEPVEVCMLFTGETELEAQEVPKGWAVFWMRPERGWGQEKFGADLFALGTLLYRFFGKGGGWTIHQKQQKHWCVGDDEEFDGWFLESFWMGKRMQHASTCKMCKAWTAQVFSDNLDFFDLNKCALCKARAGPSDQGPVQYLCFFFGAGWG